MTNNNDVILNFKAILINVNANNLNYVKTLPKKASYFRMEMSVEIDCVKLVGRDYYIYNSSSFG